MEQDLHIILVTGAARSGTSMVGGVLDRCGAYGGVLAGPTGANRRGMFENNEIREKILKPYLKSIGCDPMGQSVLPTKEQRWAYTKEQAEKLRKDVLSVFVRQGWDQKSPLFYKGAKVCLVWPLWAAAFPEAKWIVVRRDAESIVLSCLKTGFMRAFTSRAGWLAWVAIHESVFEEMIDHGLDLVEVWPERMINGDFTGMQNTVNRVGLEWREDPVRDFISPELWHFRGRQRGISL